MTLRIRVEMHGHSHHVTYEGEALAWLQGIADNTFSGENTPVPCVVLKRQTDVLTLPLQHPLYQVKVSILARQRM